MDALPIDEKQSELDTRTQTELLKTSSQEDIIKKKISTVKQGFDRAFRALVKELEEVINERYGIAAEFGSVRSELVCLRKYLFIYNNTSPEEHYQYFETLYGRKRGNILNSLKDDTWLRKGRVIIQFGEGIKATKEIEEKRRQIKILLSDIFLIACDLQDKAEKTLEGIHESLAQGVAGKDLIRPNILLLQLIRIFYYLNEGNDKKQLGIIVTKLEEDLGVTKKTVDNTQETVPVPTVNLSSTNALGGLYNMATSMMEKLGHKPPPDMVPPSEQQISNVMNKVFNDQNTQNVIGGMLSSLKDCNNFETAIQQVMKSISDPTTLQAFQGTITETVKSAMDNKDKPQ